MWIASQPWDFNGRSRSGHPCKMKTDQGQKTDLPLKSSLSMAYAASFLICVLLVVVSIAGIRFRVLIYPTEALVRTFVPNDVVNLGIGLPVLLGCMCLARGGKWIGLLSWIGTLFFVLYNTMAYVFALSYNWAFLVHLVLATLSVYTLIGLIANIDASLVRQRLKGAVPEKLAGGVLAGLGLLFLFRVMAGSVNALTRGVVLAETDLAVNISDFLTSPAWIIGGCLLWQRKELGYVAGLGLLLQGSLLFVALVMYMIVQSFLTSTPFPILDATEVMSMGLLCFIPFGLFFRGVVSEQAPPEGKSRV
jgi:hypothetical protein